MENKESIQHEKDQSQSIGKLALALSKAQNQMSGAVKGSENPFFKSSYADLHACIEAAREPLSSNELAVIQTTEPESRGVTIITTLAHSSGEWIRGRITMTPKKDDDQARGSSITYGRRYAFAAIIGLAQKDDDGNGATEQPKNQNQNKPPENKKPEAKKEDQKPQYDKTLFPRIKAYLDGFKVELETGGFWTPDELQKAWDDNVEDKLQMMPPKERDDITLSMCETIDFLISKESKQ